MSHQTRQLNTVDITSLDLLDRAVSSIEIPDLKTTLRLDRSRSDCRYYGENIQKGYDAVITYARALTPSERGQNYEIGVKKELKDGKDIYVLYADTHASDRDMTKKVEAASQHYFMQELRQEGAAAGALDFVEMASPVGEGWRRMEIVMPD